MATYFHRTCSYCIRWFLGVMLQVPAGALKAYEASLAAAPECSTVHCNKAAALAKLGQHEDAIAAARQALKLNTDYDKVTHATSLCHVATSATLCLWGLCSDDPYGCRHVKE